MYRSGRKTGLKILIGILLMVGLLTAGYFVLDTYTIQTVYVEGNVHYTEEEIKNFVMDGALGNNSLVFSSHKGQYTKQAKKSSL